MTAVITQLDNQPIEVSLSLSCQGVSLIQDSEGVFIEAGELHRLIRVLQEMEETIQAL